jgi:hypothetical protein
MKLFKVTYMKVAHPSKGLMWEEHKEYFLSNSLDELYYYIENELHFDVINIEILKHRIATTKTEIYTE